MAIVDTMYMYTNLQSACTEEEEKGHEREKQRKDGEMFESL